jgi:hypothetical protein
VQCRLLQRPSSKDRAFHRSVLDVVVVTFVFSFLRRISVNSGLSALGDGDRKKIMNSNRKYSAAPQFELYSVLYILVPLFFSF